MHRGASRSGPLVQLLVVAALIAAVFFFVQRSNKSPDGTAIANIIIL